MKEALMPSSRKAEARLAKRVASYEARPANSANGQQYNKPGSQKK